MNLLLRPLAVLANNLLPHHNGDWKSSVNTLRGCDQCHGASPTKTIRVHREATTGRLHSHCPNPHCRAIVLVSVQELVRPLARFLAPLCYARPDENTLAWYKWSPDWRSSYFNMNEVWLRQGDRQIYILVPQSNDTVRLQVVPETVRQAYEASRASLQAAQRSAGEAAELQSRRRGNQ